MRDSLLEAISKASGIDEIIIVTHNIDFLFLQAFVFEKLKSRGSLKLTVFADAGAHWSPTPHRPSFSKVWACGIAWYP